jgi:hypothetical protein
MLEENVKIVNEIMEEEESNRKKEEEVQQKGMPDTSSMMKNASNMGNMGNNFSMPSM